jgi:beta-N-acetylhexosaminidase
LRAARLSVLDFDPHTVATKPKLDLRAQVGQTLIMGFEGVEMPAKLRTTLQSLQPAGIILFARNLREPRQTAELLRECQRCTATPLFLCVDLEGGTVDRMRELIAPTPSVADVAASGNRQLFRKHGRLLGHECSMLGFNTDFAPVLDLAGEPSRSVLTSRTVSADPKQVVIYAREFLRGLNDVRILGCGKHFPGLGEASLDTHKELPSIAKPWKRLWEEDLYPYRMLHRQLPFIMVAHASYPSVDQSGAPASLSRKWISGILREKLGYRGLVVSDDMEMGGVQAALPIGEASVASLKAGSDIFLVCHHEEAVWNAYSCVLRTAEQDRRFAARVTEASRRVLAFKTRRAELRCRRPVPSQTAVDKVRRSLWQLGEEARLGALSAADSG